MNLLNNRFTGWTAVAAGLCALGIMISLSAVNTIGGYGDVLGALGALLIIPALIAIGNIVVGKHETIGRFVLVVAVLGTLIDFIQYVLFISGILGEQAESWDALARSFIGVAILTFTLLNRKNPELKRLYIWLSIVLGIVMAGPFIVLIIPLFLVLDNSTMTEQKDLGRLVQGLGILGALIEFVQFCLFTLSGKQVIYGHYIGVGLIGMAILLSALQNRRNPQLRLRFIWLCLVLGWAVFHIALDSAVNEAADQMFQGGSLAEVNPIAVAMLITFALIYLLGWPTWLLWTGRQFLKGRLTSASEKSTILQTGNV